MQDGELNWSLLVSFSAIGEIGWGWGVREVMWTNESSGITHQVVILMVTLCHLLFTSSPVFYLFSQFEKVAGGHAFDVLKVDGWRLLTLHSTLKIEEDIWRDRGRGEAVRRQSCRTSSLSSPGCGPNSSLQQGLLTMQCCQVADF